MESTKTKVIFTVALLTIGVILTAIAGVGSPASADQEEGMVIDFGDRHTVWAAFDVRSFNDPVEALKHACAIKGYNLVISDGKVKSIDGYASSETGRSWNIWGIPAKSNRWSSLDYGIKLSDYTLTSWSYCSSSETPTVGADQSGTSIYGYRAPSKIVTLSPSVTEMLCSVGATKSIAGTDRYSNYPSAIVNGQKNGSIRLVGDYTTPNYEAIVNLNPDTVFCDGCQYNHIQVAERLRSVNIPSVVMYAGEGMDTILDNMFIAGIVTGNGTKAVEAINALEKAMAAMQAILDSSQYAIKPPTMLALSGDNSPWVSGSNTYAHDVLIQLYGVNVFSKYNGWSHINSEQIMDKNPSFAIIISNDFASTQSEYDALVSSLSAEWKSTNAYKDGNIYLICEGAADLAQRPGPRFAQLGELFCRILNPVVFDEIPIPKIVGDDYKKYLIITKNLDPEG